MISLNRHLLLLVLSALLPLLAVAVGLTALLAYQDRERMERALLENTRLLSDAIDAELRRSIAGMQALARSEALRRGDLKAFYAKAREVRQELKVWDNVLLLSPSGEHLLNLLRPYGEKLPPLPQPEGALEAARTRDAYISNGLRGRVDTEWLMYITYPVIHDGQVAYVLGVTLSNRYWSQWLRDHVPAGMIAGILDRNFTFLARTVDIERLAGQPVQPWYRDLLAAQDHGTARGRGVLDPDVVVAFARSELSGWRVNVLTSGSYVDAPMKRTALLLALGVLLALAIAATLALRRARVLARDMHTVRRALESMQGPAPVPSDATSSIAEIAATLQAARETAAALKERGERLRETDRRKDEFLATLAHELRGPLAPIRNAVEILGLRRSPDPMASDAREIIARQVRHLSRLVDDLLDVARITRGEIHLRRQPVEVAVAVQGAMESARPLIERAGLRVEVSCPAGLPRVNADPTRVVQIVFNLLSNAVKFTPAGGTIRVQARADGPFVELSVTDSGIGLAPEDIGYIFEMFAQAHSADQHKDGLGIGLALVKGLVHAHGGTVEARSEGRGKGATFIVRLPAIPAAAPESGRDEAPAATSGSRCRVLIVDDLRDAAESLASLLRLQGHETFVAFDAREALRIAGELRPDAVILDIGMPGMNGYEVARELRAKPWGADLLLVALSGWGQQQDRERAMEAGFDVHLTKPADPERIQAILAMRPARQR